MGQTLIISDELYARLQAAAQQRGLSRIEQLLDLWQTNEEEVRQRQQAVQQIDRVRERLFHAYGEMSDSVNLIREDRNR